MKCCFLFVIFINFLCFAVFAETDVRSTVKCDEYADLPEPPCCGAPISLKGRMLVNYSTPAYPKDIPYFVSVNGCGGTLINSRWVLTAAHCFADNDQIGGGSVGIGRKGPKIKIDFWLKHPFYMKYTTKLFDIGLVRMIKPVVITSYLQPLCLPLGKQFQTLDFSERHVTVVGWYYGKDRNKTNKAINVAKVWPNHVCSTSHSRVRICIKRRLTAGDCGSAMSMISDYNPLKLKARYVVGVYHSVGWGVNYFARVDANIEWIKAVIQANSD